jgi:YidC/Oxa1 family membrane protein insertase
LLGTIHDFVGNWGWSIILLTIIIKAAFYKLSETSYKSMANMRKLTPRLQAMKDRYGDDKQRLNQAMMEMYKKEKVNPLGGCLPILVQIPVFISLYWVRGDASGPIHPVDRQPLRQRPLLHPSPDHGCLHVCSAEAQSGSTGSDAGEDHDEPTLCIYDLFRLLSSWIGALLGSEQPHLYRPAVVYHA